MYFRMILSFTKKQSDLGTAEGSRWVRSGNRLFSFHDYDPLARVLTEVQIIDLGEFFRPIKILKGHQAKFLSEKGEWTLSDVSVGWYKPDGTLSHIEPAKATVDISLPFDPDKLKRERRETSELSISELNDLITRGERLGLNILPFKVEWHIKFAYPLAALIVSLIGLRFGYRSERSAETAKGVLLAFFIGISYWFVLMAGRALGKRGDIHPFVAAWLPNVLILFVIVLDTLRLRRAA